MKILPFVIALVLCSSLAMAVPPFLTGDPSFSSGYIIEFPLINQLKQNEDFSFHFHIFNISNGRPIQNASTACAFHLYNSSGSHIVRLKQPKVDNEYDFEFKVMGNNFSKVGMYTYIVQCNSSQNSLGGFESVQLAVTPDGNDGNGILPAIIALTIFSILCATIGVMMWKGKEEKEGKDEKT